MAKNREQNGAIIDFTATSTIASGAVVVIKNLVGVAQNDMVSGQTGAVAITQVYSLPKVDAAVIAQGEAVHWDLSAGKVDDAAASPAAGDLLGWGVAFESKGVTTNGSIDILLTPNAQTVVT